MPLNLSHYIHLFKAKEVIYLLAAAETFLQVILVCMVTSPSCPQGTVAALYQFGKSETAVLGKFCFILLLAPVNVVLLQWLAFPHTPQR